MTHEGRNRRATAAETVERIVHALTREDRSVSPDRQACWEDWIQRVNAQGLDVEIVDATQGPPAAALLGTRICLRHSGVRGRRLWGVASSRLTSKLEDWSSWFAALRMVCSQIDASSDSLLVFQDTTAEVYASRAAELFGCPVVVGSAPADHQEFDAWMDQMSKADLPASANNRLWLSPLVETQSLAANASGSRDRDRCLMALSQHLVALYVRRGGNVERLLKLRLGVASQTHTTRLMIGASLTDERVRDDLLSAGAVGWYLCSIRDDESAHGPTTSAQSTNRTDVIVPFESSEVSEKQSRAETPPVEPVWHYLTHCTRRRRGPWPNQSKKDYVDDLLLDRDTDRSPFAALQRIIGQRCLLASAQVIRGSAPVVSFTAVSLSELTRLRVFRPHRGTWDFEPYGICIRRDWLIKRATRPVRYAGEQQWNELSTDQRPFFQKHASITKTGAVWDWTAEQEWRHLGDLDLSQLAPGDAFVFVPTPAEKERLLIASPWPVEILASGEHGGAV